MAAGLRALRRYHQPQLRASDRVPDRRSVLDLRAAARDRLRARRPRADLRGNRPGRRRRRSDRAGDDPHRRGRRGDGCGAPALTGGAGTQALRHGRSRSPEPDERMSQLAPLAFAVPLTAAALLAAVGSRLPAWAVNATALLIGTATTVM